MEEERQKKSFEIDMVRGPVLKKMLMFSLPLMCSSILQLLFNAADIIVVGRFAGDNSLAAVGSNTSLITLMTNLFIGVSIGANVTVAKYYGAKRERELKDTVHTAMTLSIISGILLTILGLIGARQVLLWMKAPEEVMDLAATYLRVYFLGMTGMMVYNFGSAILRAVGDTRRPLYYLGLFWCNQCGAEPVFCHRTENGCGWCRHGDCYFTVGFGDIDLSLSDQGRQWDSRGSAGFAYSQR